MQDLAEHIIIIGGSAGALEIIDEVLASLPRQFSSSIVIVIHRSNKYKTYLEENLKEKYDLPIFSVYDKDPILKGRVYFAPPGYHLIVETNRTFMLDIDDPVLFSRPAIDLTFSSAAEVFRESCTAFLLSGANQDGSEGTRQLLNNKSKVFIQDPKEAKVSTMPESAIKKHKNLQLLGDREIVEYFSKLQ